MAHPASSPQLWHQLGVSPSRREAGQYNNHPVVSPGASPGVGGAIYPAAAAAGMPLDYGGGSPQGILHSSPGSGRGYDPAPRYVQHDGGGSPQGQDVVKFRVLEQRLADLEARLADAEQREDGSWRNVHGQVDKLREALDTQQRTRDVLDDRKNKELQLLESTMQTELSAEKQERREVEQLMLRQIDERIAQLRDDVLVDARRREGDIALRNEEISRSIEALAVKIDRTQQLGDERCSKVADMLREEVGRLSNILGIEKKMRETTEATMFKMLEEMCVKLQKEIALERKEREKAEEGLLRLLEDTCANVESSMRQQ
eukprot:Hpha_TRINITY_DN15945_c1_g4::TRINITY_DN15945_c1_g4_i1::g.75419::m.75419